TTFFRRLRLINGPYQTAKRSRTHICAFRSAGGFPHPTVSASRNWSSGLPASAPIQSAPLQRADCESRGLPRSSTIGRQFSEELAVTPRDDFFSGVFQHALSGSAAESAKEVRLLKQRPDGSFQFLD